MTFFFLQNKRMRFLLFLFVISIILSIIGCSSNKVPVGLQSTFVLQQHHIWYEDISTTYIDSYQQCCHLEKLPIYLHRVIKDERGWLIFISAGEGVSKKDIASTMHQKADMQHLISKIVLDEWNWTTKNADQVIRFAYDEPKSGLLITLDFLIPPNSLLSDKSLIEKDLRSCLKFH